MAQHRLDLAGLKCPLPVFRIRRALAGLPAGDRLIATCTDPLAVIDVPHLVRETGDVLVEVRQDGRAHLFTIQRNGTP